MLDKRNVLDEYKGLTNTQIKADLDRKRFKYSIVCNNLSNDFNLGSLVRCANAFGAYEIVMLGRRKYDKRSTVGTHNYANIVNIPDRYALRNYLWKPYNLVIGIEQDPSAFSYTEFVDIIENKHPSHIYLMFGNEDNGMEDEDRTICDAFLEIPQYGSVRSINVACAGAIVMSHVAEYFNSNCVTGDLGG